MIHDIGDVKLALQTHVEFNQGCLDREGKDVDALAFLETDSPVRVGVTGHLGLDVLHDELWGLSINLLEELVDDSLDTCTSSATAATLNEENLLKECVTSCRVVTDFSIWMETKHLRRLSW